MVSSGPKIRPINRHGGLVRGFTHSSLGTNHREAKNAVVVRADNRLHEALLFAGRLRPQHRARRQPCDARDDALAFRLTFAQPHMGERRVGEHAIWNLPITRAAVPSGEVIPDDLKVVDGDVGELWAAGAFPDGPDLGRALLQPLIHAIVAATVQLDARLLTPDPCRLPNTPHRAQV